MAMLRSNRQSDEIVLSIIKEWQLDSEWSWIRSQLFSKPDPNNYITKAIKLLNSIKTGLSDQ